MLLFLALCDGGIHVNRRAGSESTQWSD